MLILKAWFLYEFHGIKLIYVNKAHLMQASLEDLELADFKTICSRFSVSIHISFSKVPFGI